MNCERCNEPRTSKNLFCSCGKLYSLPDLRKVRVAGFVGVQHTLNENVQKFWATGDPGVFAPSK